MIGIFLSFYSPPPIEFQEFPNSESAFSGNLLLYQKLGCLLMFIERNNKLSIIVLMKLIKFRLLISGAGSRC